MAALLSLGTVTVSSGDTAVRVTTDTSIEGYSVVIQALSANTGVIYVGTSASMNRTTLAGVIYVIPVGGVFNSTAFGLNGLRLSDLWLKSAEDGEGALVAYLVN